MENINKDLAKAYYKLLMSLDLKDEMIFTGIREGLGKFLSNLFLNLTPGNKYEKGHFYSEEALKKMSKKDFKGMVFEHMVPKEEYIQKPCREAAINGRLNEKDVLDLLEKFWKIAVITKDEYKLLLGKKMPGNWDGENIFARYEHAKIKLIERE